MSLSTSFKNANPVIGFRKKRYDRQFKPSSPRQQPRMKSRRRRRYPKPKR